MDDIQYQVNDWVLKNEDEHCCFCIFSQVDETGDGTYTSCTIAGPKHQVLSSLVSAFRKDPMIKKIILDALMADVITGL